MIPVATSNHGTHAQERLKSRGVPVSWPGSCPCGCEPCFLDVAGQQKSKENPHPSPMGAFDDDSLGFGLLAGGLPRPTGLHARERMGGRARTHRVRKPGGLSRAWTGLFGANLDRTKSQ